MDILEERVRASKRTADTEYGGVNIPKFSSAFPCSQTQMPIFLASAEEDEDDATLVATPSTAPNDLDLWKVHPLHPDGKNRRRRRRSRYIPTDNSDVDNLVSPTSPLLPLQKSVAIVIKDPKTGVIKTFGDVQNSFSGSDYKAQMRLIMKNDTSMQPEMPWKHRIAFGKNGIFQTHGQNKSSIEGPTTQEPSAEPRKPGVHTNVAPNARIIESFSIQRGRDNAHGAFRHSKVGRTGTQAQDTFPIPVLSQTTESRSRSHRMRRQMAVNTNFEFHSSIDGSSFGLQTLSPQRPLFPMQVYEKPARSSRLWASRDFDALMLAIPKATAFDPALGEYVIRDPGEESAQLTASPPATPKARHVKVDLPLAMPWLHPHAQFATHAFSPNSASIYNNVPRNPVLPRATAPSYPFPAAVLLPQSLPQYNSASLGMATRANWARVKTW